MKNKIKFIQGINYKEIANNKNIIKFGGLVLKNLKRIGYIILIVIIAVLGFVIYSNAIENPSQGALNNDTFYVHSVELAEGTGPKVISETKYYGQSLGNPKP